MCYFYNLMIYEYIYEFKGIVPIVQCFPTVGGYGSG